MQELIRWVMMRRKMPTMVHDPQSQHKEEEMDNSMLNHTKSKND